MIALTVVTVIIIVTDFLITCKLSYTYIYRIGVITSNIYVYI